MTMSLILMAGMAWFAPFAPAIRGTSRVGGRKTGPYAFLGVLGRALALGGIGLPDTPPC
jgi:hypothetical protein